MLPVKTVAAGPVMKTLAEPPAHEMSRLDMTTWFKVLPLFFVLMLGYGCVATGSQKITEPGRTAGIEAGKSTQAEVSALLGFPAIVTYGEKGQETWNYYYVTEYPTATDFIPVVDAVVSGLQQNTRDADGYL